MTSLAFCIFYSSQPGVAPPSRGTGQLLSSVFFTGLPSAVFGGKHLQEFLNFFS